MTERKFSKEKKKIVIIVGTRPDVIKFASLISELKRHPHLFQLVIISTGQHREMFEQTKEFFHISPDYNLDIMRSDQSLFYISESILHKMELVLETEKPDILLVQGDTPSAFAAALAAFYARIPIGHIEAGLRTYAKLDPFPEEMNRQLIDVLSDWYFVPTEENKKNLLKEGKEKERIFVTGNTVIDAVLELSQKHYPFKVSGLSAINYMERRVILFTCHRRESWGKQMEEIFQGLLEIINTFADTEVIFPVHLNPKIQSTAVKVFQGHKRIHLFEPLDYSDIIKVIKHSYLVVTDSGGLQEEAPALNKPVIVLRNKTERTEGILAGTLKLAGTTKAGIQKTLMDILSDDVMYQRMVRSKNPYGDGKASLRIREAINQILSLSSV